MKFPRKVVCARKSSLGIGLLAPSTIINALNLKLHLGCKRASSQVAEMIKINKDNAES